MAQALKAPARHADGSVAGRDGEATVRVVEAEVEAESGPPPSDEPSVDDSGVWLAFARGAVVGFVAVGILVVVMSLAVGLGWTVAVALGLFTGVWGGPGFGGMMGAVLHHSRNH